MLRGRGLATSSIIGDVTEGGTPRFTFGSADQARRYDAALASQVFRPWVESMVELNDPVPGNVVLDLACGTGVCALVLAERIGGGNISGGGGGRVVGIDASRGMLEVARAKLDEKTRGDGCSASAGKATLAPVDFLFGGACDPDTPWHETQLRRFDRAYCHQGLQFFKDPEEGCRRVRLALKPGGQFTVAVWAHVARQPLFAAVKMALESVGRPEWAAMAAGAPFSWDATCTDAGAVDKLETTLIRAGFDAPDAATERGEIYFADMEDAAGVVRAAPFWDELAAEEHLWDAYVAEVERHLAVTAGDTMRIVPRGAGTVDESVLAIPAVAHFGHATAPWN